jgi:hypothetical protein
MPVISINQAVDVHWRLPSAQRADGPIIDDKVTRTFENLIPACEFAVAMAKEGNLDIHLYLVTGPVLDLAGAQRIVDVWESGQVSLEAEEMDY